MFSTSPNRIIFSLFALCLLCTYQAKAQVPSADMDFLIKVFDAKPENADDGSEALQIIGTLSVMEFADGNFAYVFAQSGGSTGFNTPLDFQVEVLEPNKYAKYYWKGKDGHVNPEVSLRITLTERESKKNWIGYVKFRFALSGVQLVDSERQYQSWEFESPITALNPQQSYWVSVSPPFAQ